MRRKTLSAGAQKREKEKERDLQKAEKRRAQEKARAAAQRKKAVALIRSGELKLKKVKPQKGVYSTRSSIPDQPTIRREDVVIDQHTSSKKEPNLYKLEGDTGW